MAHSEIQRRLPPAPGPVRSFRFPPFERHRLDNGLELYLAPYDRGPLIHMVLMMRGGAQHEAPGKAGLATLMASLMDEGTEQCSALELAEQVEQLGGYLATIADWDSLTAEVGALSQYLGDGLDLLSQIVTQATYPEHELERLRRQQLAELQRRSSQPSAMASDALTARLYGPTPYATSILGTSDTVAALTREHIVDHASSHVTPCDAALVLVGDLDSSSARTAVQSALGGWRGPRTPVTPRLEPPAVDGLRLCLVDRPDAPQTELRLGHVGVPRTHPEFIGLQVLNTLLGGKFTSRINLNLRERRGITYGASSSFSQRLGPGPFVIRASVATDSVAEAIREILFELRRLQDEPADHEELEDTKSYLLGVFPYTLQRIEGLSSRLMELTLYDLPADYFDRYPERLRSITASHLRALAQQHLHPEQMVVVAVGPRTDLEAQLTALGPLEIESETNARRKSRLSL